MGNNKNYDKVIKHPNYIKNTRRLIELSKNKKIQNERLYLESPKYCKQCSKKIEYKDRAKVFCNRSCAATFDNNKRPPKSISLKKKISKTLLTRAAEKQGLSLKEYLDTKKAKESNSCKFCLAEVKKPKMICISCRDSFQNVYSFRCRFNFSLKQFADEFDFSLVKEYGWYKAKNKGNNLDGVSRDHKFSIINGFKNNIDPLLISHPANCQLLLQRNNSKKRHNSSITLEELIEDILKFEKKYNYCPEVLEYIKTLHVPVV